MRIALFVLAAIGVLAIIFVIVGFLIRLLAFLFWLGLILLIVAALVFVYRSARRGRI